MGEVWRAKDTKLGREVAIKTLPAEFAQDSDRLARFEREAKLLASLNHPNIAAIHGFEEDNGTHFIVLELVEGDTLADRIRRGAIPVEESLELAVQITKALEAAHEKGVVHRDLKPANIKVTGDGDVKVLDFGLAKAFVSDDADVNPSNSPTLSMQATQQGVILGTAAYMSPEQAKGLSADARSDAFSFGCVLYEILAGRQPFQGETSAEMLASIIAREPDFNLLPVGLNARLYDLLRRCLEKHPKRRWQAIGDLRAELEFLQLEVYAKPQIAQSVGANWSRRETLAWTIAAAAVLTTILTVAISGLVGTGEPDEEVRFLISVPRMPDLTQVSVSPDGRNVAFVALVDGGSTQLFVRPIDSVVAQPLTGTDGAQNPFWSPDSEHIGFSAGTTLTRVAVAGGAPQILSDLGPQSGRASLSRGGGTWNNEGIIVFSNSGRLHRVSAAGGVLTPITVLDASLGETGHLWPYFLPDGNRFLYLAWSDQPENRAIYAGTLDSEERVRLLMVESMPVFASPEFLLFQRQGTLMAQRFDTATLALQEEPIRLGEDIPFNFQNGRAAFAASHNGVLAFRSDSSSFGSQQFKWVDRSGETLVVAGEAGLYTPNFDLSPDGSQIAVGRINQTARRDLWMLEWESGRLTRLTFDSMVDGGAGVVWSPDGLRLAFNTVRNGNPDIVEISANGIGDPVTLLDSSTEEWVEDWSRDGSHIVYRFGDDLYVLPMSDDREPFPIVEAPGRQDEARLSFDGNWLAYVSDESGDWETYLTSFPAGDQKLLVSSGGGSQPRWKPDGRELYYLSLDGKLMAVDITTGNGTISVGTPNELFDAGLLVDPVRDQFAVSPNGEQFLVQAPVSGATSPITVVLNWNRP